MKDNYKDTVQYKRGYSDALLEADVFFVPDGTNVHRARVYGLRESIRGAKFPKAVDINKLNSDLTKGIQALAQSNQGEGHDQWLTGCIVQFDLTFSNKAWVEAERYHFFDFVSSQSTMHKIAQFDIKEQCNRNVDPRIISILREKVDAYNYLVKLPAPDSLDVTFERDKLIKNAYLDVLYNIPSGFQLTARMTTNYRQLKTMYKQRKSHRLPEWRDFCQWVETLPYANLITGDDNNAQEP